MVAHSKLSTTATCDGKPLHPLAMKVPKTLCGSRTRPGSAVDYDHLNRVQLVAIIDKLMKRQQYITPMYSVLFSDDYPMGEGNDELMCDAAWPASGVRALRRVPKGWVAQWFLRFYGKAGFTKVIILGIEKEDTSGLMFLFSVVLQLPLGTPLPKELEEDGELAAQVFYLRATLVGKRLETLIALEAVTSNGFDFGKGNAYEIAWSNEGRAQTVKHTFSGQEVELPAHVCVTRAFKMFDGWMDSVARVELSPSSFVLCQLFSEGAFVDLLATEKNGKRLLQAAHESMNKPKLAATVASADGAGAASSGSTDMPPPTVQDAEGPKALQHAKKLRQSSRTAAARAVVQQKAQERETKRVLKLD